MLESSGGAASGLRKASSLCSWAGKSNWQCVTRNLVGSAPGDSPWLRMEQQMKVGNLTRFEPCTSQNDVSRCTDVAGLLRPSANPMSRNSHYER
jgi:hypothetical protein